MSKFFQGLKLALEEAVEHSKGKIHLETITIDIPEAPEEYKPKQIKKIRETCNYSQSVFAEVLNVSIKTVQSWESGQRVPSPMALRFLEIIDKGIYRPQIYKNN